MRQAEQVRKAQQGFLQHRQVEPVGDAGAGLGGGDQFRFTQRLKVGRQRGLAEGEVVGSVGVLGPTRMNYPQALATVEVVGEQLGRRIAEGGA